MIFNQVITNYINPDNLTPDLTTDDGDKYARGKSRLYVFEDWHEK